MKIIRDGETESVYRKCEGRRKEKKKLVKKKLGEIAIVNGRRNTRPIRKEDGEGIKIGG